MGFPENLKLAVKRRAHFACCLCHGLGVEVHHIFPEAEAGPETEDNAAPLCPSCHEAYGANPTKRKFIRESRDFWYEICGKRYASDPDRLNEIGELLRQAATKDDLNRAVDKMSVLLHDAANRPDSNVRTTATEVSSLGGMLAPGVGFNRSCKNCGTFIGVLVGDEGKCPECGNPW